MGNHEQTPWEKKLTDALQKKGIDFEIHHKDYYTGTDGTKRHKTVDILLLAEKIFIEVDGLPHLTDPKKIIADFNRDYFSHKKGYFTKHITNEAIDSNLEEIVDAIACVVDDAPNKMGENLRK